MSDNKSVKLSPFVEIRELHDFQKIAGNLYKSVLIIAKRANQLNVSTNEELREKLQEFGSTTDDMEEIHENVEQIEISKLVFQTWNLDEEKNNPFIVECSSNMRTNVSNGK